MPSCFALISKEFPKSGPAMLQGVDNLMREHFGNKETNPDEWYRNWYNTIGLALAIGHRWDAIKDFFPDKVDIVDWLAANYTVDSWKEWR